MKFAKHLAAHITPEWRKQYIQYELMKTMIYAEREGIATTLALSEDAEAIERTTRKFHDKFFLFCDNEVTKINAFFSEKLSEANRKLNNMKSDMEYCRAMETITPKQFKFVRKIYGPDKKVPLTKHSLKLAFSEYYLSLILLQNYQELNYTGFQKILKKYDKVMKTSIGAAWFEDSIKSSYFANEKNVENLIKKTEDIVTKELGNRKKAMKVLSVPPLTEMCSMSRVRVVSRRERNVRQFNTTGIEIVLSINDDDLSFEDFYTVFEELVNWVQSDFQPDDRVGIQMSMEGLRSEVFVPFTRVDQLTVKRILDLFEKIVQSNENIPKKHRSQGCLCSYPSKW